MTVNWYPGKKHIESIKLNPLPKKGKKQEKRVVQKNQIAACPICNGRGLVRDMKTDEWRPCAAGSPYHKTK